MFERRGGQATFQFGPGLKEPTLTASQAVEPGPLGQQSSHRAPRTDPGLGPCSRQYYRRRSLLPGRRQFRGEKSARCKRKSCRQQTVGARETRPDRWETLGLKERGTRPGRRAFRHRRGTVLRNRRGDERAQRTRGALKRRENHECCPYPAQRPASTDGLAAAVSRSCLCIDLNRLTASASSVCERRSSEYTPDPPES